jgi:hypothetical protein
LAFAAAPTALGIDVQHAKSHGAQHPLSTTVTQVSSSLPMGRAQ